MKLFVAVVSHGHESLIANNPGLRQIATIGAAKIVVRDNTGSSALRDLAVRYGYHYQSSPLPMGFGANNNAVFDSCINELGACDGDYFCLLNPDVLIKPEVLAAVVEEAKLRQLRFVTLDLVQDQEGRIPDLNIKRFPSLLDFAKGFLLGANPAAYDKSAICEPCAVDWASGAFMLFRVDLFKSLSGFDERFFMYLEDVDISRRALELYEESLWYFPQFQAVHLCQQANKRLLSRHFWWFLRSMIQYFWKYRFRTRPKYSGRTTDLE